MSSLVFYFISSLLVISIQDSCAQCSFSYGDYSVSWVLDRSNHVRFQLIKTRMPDNTWVAIAFGYSMKLVLEFRPRHAMIKVINGRVFVTDESVHHYGPSIPDYSQNVQAQRASYANGVLRVTFSRPMFASEYFADHSLVGCTPWQFVTVGGMVHGYRQIGKHFQYPIMRTVCTQQCRI